VEWLNAAAGIQPASTLAETPALAAGSVGSGIELAVYDEPLDEPSSATPAARFQPRDAFDPEVFNRKFADLAAELEPETGEESATEPVETLEPEPSPMPEP
jgi:hypothetical protein